MISGSGWLRTWRAQLASDSGEMGRASPNPRSRRAGRGWKGLMKQTFGGTLKAAPSCGLTQEQTGACRAGWRRRRRSPGAFRENDQRQAVAGAAAAAAAGTAARRPISPVFAGPSEARALSRDRSTSRPRRDRHRASIKKRITRPVNVNNALTKNLAMLPRLGPVIRLGSFSFYS